MKNIEKILDKIRPALERDDGSIELDDYDQKKGNVKVSLTGACAHCPMADMTLKGLIEQEIKGQMPEVKEVVAV